MTIRWKLNLAVIALITIFLLTAAFTMRVVRATAEHTRTYSRMRELAELISGIDAGIHRHPAAARGLIPASDGPASLGWLQYALHDIDTQIRLAESDEERELWSNLRHAVAALENSDPASTADPPESLLAIRTAAAMGEVVRAAEESLRALRNIYQAAEYDSIASASEKSLRAQQAIWIAGSLTALLFLVYVIMVRDWLVRPIELLKSAADAIGAGELDCRVPLKGNDELAQLARRLEAMASRLAVHQAALLKARELSAIGELCTNVAHGLRNPLAAIRTSAQPAKRRDATPEQLERIIRDVMRQTDRMDERITKLFEFSRPQEPHLDWATFRQIALTAQAHTRSLVNEREVRLTIDDHSGEAKWYVDRDELAEALAELVTNAVTHSAAGSEVIIRGELLSPSKDAGKRLQIQIIDHGAGMGPAEVGKAFNLFFSRRPDGTGMGLAIVRRSVEKHGGEVTLASEVGSGTIVTITLSEEPGADYSPPRHNGTRNLDS